MAVDQLVKVADASPYSEPFGMTWGEIVAACAHFGTPVPTATDGIGLRFLGRRVVILPDDWMTQ